MISIRRSIFAAAATLSVGGMVACTQASADPGAPAPRRGAADWGIVIHGGAGTIARGSMTPEREAEYHATLEQALRAGHAVLADGGIALDAVEAAINVMEDSPLFNAGHGAVFTSAGTNELDAAVMDGRTRNAGAVAGLTRVRNPIDLARLVMEESPHVMMIGTGAETFGEQHGIEFVDPSYFHTDSRWESLQRARAAEPRDTTTTAAADPWGASAWKMGTVGAVALDQAGNVAAGTSTGGMTNKRWGRVGDVPIIGAGTYADNRCGGVSATGHGEYFIRSVVSYDICAIHMYTGIPMRDAADQVVMQKLVEFGGEGGVIVMDMQGNVSMPFNSSGMYRGMMMSDGRPTTAIYRD